MRLTLKAIKAIKDIKLHSQNMQYLPALSATRFQGLPLAGATAVTKEIVEFRAGFPTMPLRARAGAKPGLQDSQKVGHFSHAFRIFTHL